VTEPTLHGRLPKTVISLLEQRRAHGYRAGVDYDGNRIALVVEGGAMRGVISSAAIDALFQLGFWTCFDDVYGTSSGALNAAYFVSGQITLGTTIYYENAIDPEFIDVWRWPDPLDIKWLIKNWIVNGKPLDVSAVMASGCDLYISTTNIRTGELHYFSNREGRPDIIIPALRASCSTPVFVTHREPIGSEYYNDGLVHAAIPITEASARNSHVVAVLTRPVGYRKVPSILQRAVEWYRVRRYPEPYRKAFFRHHAVYNDALDMCYLGTSNMATLVLAPGSDDYVVANSENRPDPLKRAVRESMKRVAHAFSVSSDSVKMYEAIRLC